MLPWSAVTRPAASHGSAGQLGFAASATEPSSTIRACADAGSASAAASTGITRRVRFMTGFQHSVRGRVADSSLVAVGDPSAVEIVRRELDLDPVTRQDADVVTPHLAGDVSEDFVPVVELDLEHRVREGLDDLALHLDLFFLRHRLAPPQMRRTF